MNILKKHTQQKTIIHQPHITKQSTQIKFNADPIHTQTKHYHNRPYILQPKTQI